MQNRNMYLYRRQGPKKRPKPNATRKPRTPQKGLPNSARDLLPLIQPATKALTQMLAGRTNASGQLGHARAMLSQIERLIGERAHNRLNPAEREEFFEQVARLRLTLADADSEAEVQAQENEAPPPAAPPVKLERLKELALALTTPNGTSASGGDAENPADGELNGGAAVNDQAEDAELEANGEDVAPARAEPEVPVDPNRLRLPRGTAERVSLNPESAKVEAPARRKVIAGERKRVTTAAARTPSAARTKAAAKPASANGASKPEAKKKGLPEGWVIDEEGFVVPGAG